MKRKIFCALGVIAALAVHGVLAAQPVSPALLFPELAGWQKQGAAETFLPETLYRHIDGAAENFLAYGFRQLAVQNYVNSQKQSLSAEIYFHGASENAFGIYSSEKPLAGNYFEIGTFLGPENDKWTDGEGYEEEGVLNFIYGSYYVKLNGFDLGPAGAGILKTLAEKIALVIPGGDSLPTLLDAFPAAGKIAHSERYILSNFLGYEFLHSTYAANYELQGRKFQVFIMQAASADEARAMLQKYAALDKENPAPAIRPGALAVRDPYNGLVQLFWRGALVWGIIGQAPDTVALLQAMNEKLKKQE